MRKLLLIISVLMMISGLSLAQDEGITAYEIASKWIEKAEQTRVFDLNLKFLGLETLPSEIGKLKDLIILEVSVNSLTELPPEIGQLTKLYRLDLGGNQLSDLPPETGNLSQLQKLSLAINQLTQLPPEIGQLKNLCKLDLSNNQLKHLPSELGQLTKLAEDGCSLNLDGNPLISPPPEVIAQGTPTVLDYLRNQAWWHLQRLIVSGATGLGLLAVLILGIRWRMRRLRQKSKRKNDGAYS